MHTAMALSERLRELTSPPTENATRFRNNILSMLAGLTTVAAITFAKDYTPPVQVPVQSPRADSFVPDYPDVRTLQVQTAIEANGGLVQLHRGDYVQLADGRVMLLQTIAPLVTRTPQGDELSASFGRGLQVVEDGTQLQLSTMGDDFDFDQVVAVLNPEEVAAAVFNQGL